jgi:L-threonylcarbamoyladenylate synthase
MMQSIAYVSDDVKKVVNHFLPGSLTVILPKRKVVSDVLSAGFDTVAVRIPDNCFALSMLQRFGPVCVTSANIHNKNTAFTIEDIRKELGSDVFLYVDKGIIKGIASTIVDMSEDCINIVRKGCISLKDIEGVLE